MIDDDIYLLMFEAMEPLSQAFHTSTRRLRYDIQETVLDGETHVKFIIFIPADCDGDAALQQFDESWWLQNCHRSRALLVFDYAIDSPMPGRSA